MAARREVVHALVVAASNGMDPKVKELNASGSEVISAYITMCRDGCLAGIAHGVSPDALADLLRTIIIEILPSKGSIT